MRNRVMNDPGNGLRWACGTGISNGVPTFGFPPSSYLYGANYGPAYCFRSNITDDVEECHSRVPKYVYHRRDSAAMFSGDDTITASYSPPTPTLYLSLKGSFMADSTVGSLPAFPANSLIDQLASLIDGNAKSRLLLPVFLIEGMQTLAMVRNPFNLLQPNFRRKVGKLTASALALKRASGIWLEQLFGWQQFKSDVDETAKAVATFLNHDATKRFCDQESRFSVTQTDNLAEHAEEYSVGTSESYWNSYVDSPSRMYASNEGIGLFRLSGVDRKITYRLGCLQRLNVLNAITRTKQFFNLTALESSWYNVRDLMWEVIPMSFVIDWFVDMRGLQYIPNYVRLSSPEVKYLCYSTKASCEYNVDWLPFFGNVRYWGIAPWSGYYPTAVFGTPFIRSLRGKSTIYMRSPGFPASEGVVTSQLLTKGLTWGQLTTGAALFAQRMIREPKRALKSQRSWWTQ